MVSKQREPEPTFTKEDYSEWQNLDRSRRIIRDVFAYLQQLCDKNGGSIGYSKAVSFIRLKYGLTETRIKKGFLDIYQNAGYIQVDNRGNIKVTRDLEPEPEPQPILAPEGEPYSQEA